MKARERNRTWDDHYMALANEWSKMSKDCSSQFGCVIVNNENIQLTAGFNSPIRYIDDDMRDIHDRPQKYSWYEHSERNAIYNASRIGVSLLGSKLYVNSIPCDGCARAIIQSGIKEVIVNKLGSEDYLSRFYEKCYTALCMFLKARVKVRLINDDKSKCGEFIDYLLRNYDIKVKYDLNIKCTYTIGEKENKEFSDHINESEENRKYWDMAIQGIADSIDEEIVNSILAEKTIYKKIENAQSRGMAAALDKELTKLEEKGINIQEFADVMNKNKIKGNREIYPELHDFFEED